MKIKDGVMLGIVLLIVVGALWKFGEKDITAAGSLLLGIAAIIALVWGPQTIQKQQLELHKHDHARKHRFDVAKRAVGLFSQVEDAVKSIRIEGVSEGEAEEVLYCDLMIEPGEPAGEHLKTIYVRLLKHADLFKNISNLRLEFLATFDQLEGDPFLTLSDIMERIENSAHTLDDIEYPPMKRKHEWDEHYIIVYGRKKERFFDEDNPQNEKKVQPDKIAQEINNVVRQVNDICLPILRGKDVEQSNESGEPRRWLLFRRKDQ